MRGRVPDFPASAAPDQISSRSLRHRVCAVAVDRLGAEKSAMLESLALTLSGIVHAKVLLLETDTQGLSGRKVPGLANLHSGLPLSSVIEDFGKWARVRIRSGKSTADEWAAFVKVLGEYFPFVIVAGESRRLTAGRFAGAGLVFHFLKGSARELLRVRSSICGKGTHRLIVTPPEGAVFPDFKWLEEKSGLPREAIRHGGVGDDTGHVARTIAGARIGLALSSGSAKGLSHIGVIEVLEKAGIPVDVVVGTSMGAYVGACWCSGHSIDGLRALAGEIKKRRDVFSLIDPVLPPRRGFIRGEKIRGRLARSVGGMRFEDMRIPFYSVATRLDTLERRVMDRGDVATAVHASLAMPGVCVPVTVNGMRYTDGAACCPMPVPVLEEMGIEKIIAVNALPSLADLRAIADAPVDERSGIGPAVLRFLNRHLNYFAPGNILDTVMRGLQAGQIRLARDAGSRADVYIHTCPEGSRWFHFDQHEQYINAGRAAALKQLDALKSLAGVNR